MSIPHHHPSHDEGSQSQGSSMHLLPTTTPYQTFSSGAMPSAASVSDDIVTRLMSALDPIFLANRQSTADRFDQLELSVKTLSEEVKTVRSEARRQARELASCLEGLHKDAVQALTDRTDSSGSEGLSNIEFALGEMLELARDPKAVSLPYEARNNAPLKVHAAVNTRPEKPSSSSSQPSMGVPVGTVHDDSAPNSPESDRHNSPGAYTVASVVGYAGESQQSRPCTVKSGLPRSPSTPFRSDTLVPVNWSTLEINSLSNNDLEPDEPVRFFQPQSSPKTMAAFMIHPPHRDSSPDGTIASLRRNALGRYFIDSSEEPGPLSIMQGAASYSILHPCPLPPSPDSLTTSPEQSMARDMSIDLDLPADSDSSVLQEYISEMISHPLLTSPSPNSPLSSLSSILSDFEEDIVQRAAPKLRVKPGVPDPREEMQKLGKARIIKKRKPKKHLTLLPVKRAKPSIKNKSSVGKMKPMTQTPKIEWPRENEGGEVFRRTFVQCDGCNLWYHYGCAGIIEGDVRIEPTESFVCPPCSVSVSGRTGGHGQDCARPDCQHKESHLEEFFVERIVGRMKGPLSGKGDGTDQACRWLVKWEGYPISQATWEGKDSMGDPDFLIAAFDKAAELEGFDLKSSSPILLMEAANGGWLEA